jgi:hypothetical protein
MNIEQVAIKDIAVAVKADATQQDGWTVAANQSWRAAA